MNHARALRILLASLAMIIIVGLIASYLYNRQLATTLNSAQNAPTPSSAPPSDSTMTTMPGVYQDYSETALANAAGIKVLFFHASWCPQCRQLDQDIRSNPLPDGVTILKVDYDSNQALRKKYDVKLQTTLVRLDDDNNAVKSYVAYNEPTLENLKKNLLQ